MEPNVWRIVEHIVFCYFASSYWSECKHKLFNLFLAQYESESAARKIDREFIAPSMATAAACEPEFSIANMVNEYISSQTQTADSPTVESDEDDC